MASEPVETEEELLQALAAGRRAVAPTPTPAVPGRAGRIDYAPHEQAIRVPVLDKVKEAKRATVESGPDILGVRGPQWSTSVAIQPGKHRENFSGQLLTNTLTPALLNASDVRKLAGSTAAGAKGDKTAATLDRTRSPSQTPNGWCDSTVTMSSQERQRQLDASTSAALTATRRKSPPASYIDPVARQTGFAEAVRYAKANNGADIQELTARYGPEGAAAMQHILAMPPKDAKPRIRTSAADLAAVRALDEFAAGVEVEEPEAEAVSLTPMVAT